MGVDAKGEEKFGEFDNIDFSKLDIGNIIRLCLKCQTKEDAKKVLEQYERYCETPEIARSSLGYIFGYCNEEDIKKLYSLFLVNHPAFGPGFGRGKEPSFKEAVEMGRKFGNCVIMTERIEKLEKDINNIRENKRKIKKE